MILDHIYRAAEAVCDRLNLKGAEGGYHLGDVDSVLRDHFAWRPMGTAPKDDTEILILFDSATVNVVRLCWWREDGWWSYAHSVTQELIEGMHPIGWMPFPARPKS